MQGVYTAIVTPFTQDGQIDWESLQSLVEFQIESGVTGIVPCGTTGESPTLTEEEKLDLISKIVEWVNERCEVIAGTGTNSTDKTVAFTKKVAALGVTGCMIVNPYYNKPTQEGLFRHFTAVGKAVDIPLLLYNIKGRTGVNVETDTLMRIVHECPNYKGVKEASGNLEQMKDVISKRPEGFSVLSGDDGITLDLIKAGGNGVVSVASNMIPGKMVKMVNFALEKNYGEAQELDELMQPFFEGEFMETNPIPIKAGLAMKGLIKETYRLPMCEMNPELKSKWRAMLSEMNLL